MDSSKLSALLLISMLFISSATPILGCNYCGKPPSKGGKGKGTPVKPSPKGPILPPVKVPPVTPIITPVVPKLPLPPVTTLPPVVPKLPLPPVTTLPPVVPKLPLPPVKVPPVTPLLPPVTPLLPPIPVIGGGGSPPSSPGKGDKPCPPPKSSSSETCPIDTLKLGACVDLLGGLVHIGLGDPVVNQCCPVLQGLVELEAAVCLCTTLKLKVLNLNLYVPLALQLLVTCGKTPPKGFTCSL
ncbi:hypothetical protein CsatB_014119 [Cannabis sativa]